MKAEGLLLEKLAQPNEAASAGERHSLEEKFSTVWIRFIFPWPFLWRRSCACCSVRFSALPPTPLWRRFLRPGGFGLAWLTGAGGTGVLAAALVIRMLITMRSPVGNTYETIAFIACMGVLCALVVELFSKGGIVLAAGLLLRAFLSDGYSV
ncbi:MAG: hypothetical protein ACLT38_11960 [Akkermansia sp.]